MAQKLADRIEEHEITSEISAAGGRSGVEFAVKRPGLEAQGDRRGGIG
jgi:hypothetical protein